MGNPPLGKGAYNHLRFNYLEAFHGRSFIREGICRCDSDLGDLKLVTILGCWWQNIDVSDIF